MVLSGFKGDPRFVQNDYAAKSFSHWRASIAGLYAWRAAHTADKSEKTGMAREADFAFQEAWALCPYSPDVVNRYTDFLKSQDRPADARLISASAAKFPPEVQPGSGKSRAQAAELPKSPAFEMRLVVDSTSADAERMTLVLQNPGSGQTRLEPLYVQKTVLLDQTAVESAKVATNALGAPQIEITLTDAGRKRFAKITRQNIGKRLAIVIDGRVCTAPVIQSEITGGKGQITGNITDQQAEALAAKINAAVAQ